MTPICPVCKQPVRPNAGGRYIALHNDGAGKQCDKGTGMDMRHTTTQYGGLL